MTDQHLVADCKERVAYDLMLRIMTVEAGANKPI